MKLLCLGFGYTARVFVSNHGARFSHVAATFRDETTQQALIRRDVEPIAAGQEDAAPLRAAIRASDAILISAGPGESGDPFLPHVHAALAGSTHAARFLYLSTVGVYGDHGGAWVDEATVPKPASKRSHLRLAAENGWLACGVDVQIFRLAGIYGPGRNALENLRNGTARRIVKAGQVFNRIHVADIALTVAAALDRGQPGAIWNVTDDEPAPPQDVVAYAARIAGVEAPPEIAFESAEMTPMARSFYGENKRVSNRAIRRDLGVELQYPTYREGLAALNQPSGSPL